MDIPVHPGRLTWFTYKSLMKRKENDLNQIFRDVIIGFQSLPLSFFLMYFSEGYDCYLSLNAPFPRRFATRFGFQVGPVGFNLLVFECSPLISWGIYLYVYIYIYIYGHPPPQDLPISCFNGISIYFSVPILTQKKTHVFFPLGEMGRKKHHKL